MPEVEVTKQGCARPTIYHYGAGRWTRQALPKGTVCDMLAWIPGTRAARAAGTFYARGGLDGVILRSPAQS